MGRLAKLATQDSNKTKAKKIIVRAKWGWRANVMPHTQTHTVKEHKGRTCVYMYVWVCVCSCVPLATACLSSLCPTPGQRRLLPQLLRPSLRLVVCSVTVGCAGVKWSGGGWGGGGGAAQGLGGGWSYRDGQRAPGWGLSGVGPVRVGRTALWKHGRETSWCIRLGRRRASGGGGGRPTCVPVLLLLLLRPKIKAGSHQEVLLVNAKQLKPPPCALRLVRLWGAMTPHENNHHVTNGFVTANKQGSSRPVFKTPLKTHFYSRALILMHY